MDARLMNTCELFTKNRNLLHRKMIWETASNEVAIMGSFILTPHGLTADPEKYAECKKILKANAGLFSQFRGIGRAMVLTKMSMQTDPEYYLQGSLAVYKKLRALHKLTASPFMVMAAMTIFENGGLEQADARIAELETLYKKEKAMHPFLITDTDRGYLSMLVCLSKDPERISDEIEDCYEAVKSMTLSKNAAHSLAQVLSLSAAPVSSRSEKVHTLLTGLKKNHQYISKYSALPAIGALALLNTPEEILIDEITEVSDYLKTQKGFKWFNSGKRTRTMYAALVVFLHHADSENAAVSESISSTVAMVLVETLIMLLIIASVNASSSAQSSSN